MPSTYPGIPRDTTVRFAQPLSAFWVPWAACARPEEDNSCTSSYHQKRGSSPSRQSPFFARQSRQLIGHATFLSNSSGWQLPMSLLGHPRLEPLGPLAPGQLGAFGPWVTQASPPWSAFCPFDSPFSTPTSRCEDGGPVIDALPRGGAQTCHCNLVLCSPSLSPFEGDRCVAAHDPPPPCTRHIGFMHLRR